jgi:hypothetical protein
MKYNHFFIETIFQKCSRCHSFHSHAVPLINVLIPNGKHPFFFPFPSLVRIVTDCLELIFCCPSTSNSSTLLVNLRMSKYSFRLRSGFENSRVWLISSISSCLSSCSEGVFLFITLSNFCLRFEEVCCFFFSLCKCAFAVLFHHGLEPCAWRRLQSRRSEILACRLGF